MEWFLYKACPWPLLGEYEESWTDQSGYDHIRAQNYQNLLRPVSWLVKRFMLALELKLTS